LADPVDDVLPDLTRLQPARGGALAAQVGGRAVVARLLHPAETPQRLLPGGGRAPPAALQLAGAHLQVEADLLVDLGAHLGLAAAQVPEGAAHTAGSSTRKTASAERTPPPRP